MASLLVVFPVACDHDEDDQISLACAAVCWTVGVAVKASQAGKQQASGVGGRV